MMSCSKHRILKRRDPVAHFHRYRDNEVDDFFGAVDFSTQTWIVNGEDIDYTKMKQLSAARCARVRVSTGRLMKRNWYALTLL